MYYLETRTSPHGDRSVVGGQHPDGRPKEEYRTPAEARAHIPTMRRALAEAPADVRGRQLIVEVNVCRTADLRIPGQSGYLRLR